MLERRDGAVWRSEVASIRAPSRYALEIHETLDRREQATEAQAIKNRIALGALDDL